MHEVNEGGIQSWQGAIPNPAEIVSWPEIPRTLESPDKKETTARSGSRQEPEEHPQADVRRPWCQPEARPISKFTILSLGPTPGALENFTFSNKSI
jgi:hypothetical protein